MNNSHLLGNPTTIPKLLPPKRAPYPLKRCQEAWDLKQDHLGNWRHNPADPTFWRKIVDVMLFERTNTGQYAARAPLAVGSCAVRPSRTVDRNEPCRRHALRAHQHWSVRSSSSSGRRIVRRSSLSNRRSLLTLSTTLFEHTN
eukprot:1184944-Prorocentrum_minimum.AAC.1